MSDVTWSVTLPGGLSFTDSSASYRLIEATPAEIRWRRITVDAPHVSGAVESAAVQDVSSYRMIVRCVGDSGTNAGTLANNLKAAATAGTLVVVLAGASETYKALAADVAVAAEFESLLNNQRVVTLTFPTQPFPT